MGEWTPSRNAGLGENFLSLIVSVALRESPLRGSLSVSRDHNSVRRLIGARSRESRESDCLNDGET